jgi:FdhD protein
MAHATQNISIQKIINGQSTTLQDAVAVEEPLEISIAYPQQQQLVFKTIAITMRTPGSDAQLALGFLFTEGIINSTTIINRIEQKGNNKICVFINDAINLKEKLIDRNFYTTSSCGICGKASIEAVQAMQAIPPYPTKHTINSQIIFTLKDKLVQQQVSFEKTGGIHAATLFTHTGALIYLAEDVGRHNALDKLIGHCYQQNLLPLSNHILLLSGRASFELIQKAAMANINTILAIGAPSSLAVELATELDITLIGFLKNNSFNIYSGILH